MTIKPGHCSCDYSLIIFRMAMMISQLAVLNHLSEALRRMRSLNRSTPISRLGSLVLIWVPANVIRITGSAFATAAMAAPARHYFHHASTLFERQPPCSTPRHSLSSVLFCWPQLRWSHTSCFLINTLYPQDPLANSSQETCTRCQKSKVGGPTNSGLRLMVSHRRSGKIIVLMV